MHKILVAGGTGYIGTHILVELLNEGYEAVAVDNLFNSSAESLRRVKEITGKDLRFYEADFLDEHLIAGIFDIEMPDAVIMCAGYKAVGESVEKPIEYYFNNLGSLLKLLDVMRRKNCHNIIFSSSATVYGEPEVMPITEDSKVAMPLSPYGKTKLFIEEILKDASRADPALNVVLLRYFNPIGAHPSGLIGEDPTGIPNNLLPYIAQVAVGRRDKLHIYGDDYDTPDGTGVRDYIHVVDLAKGHVKALRKLSNDRGVFIYNLGTGKGASVLEVVKAYEEASGVKIPYVIEPRRPGDTAVCYCDPSLAKKELNWEANLGIFEMCRDAHNWQVHNPYGYGERSEVPMCLSEDP